jgi:probable HAF family extracellular repeat protein
MTLRLVAAGLSLVSILVSPPYAARVQADPPSYAVENLGSLGGDSYGRAVNASGTVAGYGALADATVRGFVAAQAGGLQMLGTLGGPDSQAFAINDEGVAAGFSSLADGNYRAFRLQDGTMTDLGTLGGPFSFAYAVNGSGVVAGHAMDANYQIIAFRETPGTGLQPLGAFGGGTSFAWGINDAGDVVGQSYLADGSAHAFLAVPGSPLLDLGTLGGAHSTATAINAGGTIVGSAQAASGMWRAFRRLPGGSLQDLGTLGGAFSSAEGINAQGDIVGWAYDASNVQRACLWTAGGEIVDLNSRIDPASGWSLVAAQAINASGQITGYGTVNGELRAFRLTPQAGDREPPVIESVYATPAVLDPPNHQLVPVQVVVSASDNSSVPPVCAVDQATSNEPDNGMNDGDTVNDMQQTAALTFLLRAERSGNGEGRTYTLRVACTDASGNMAHASAYVRVPKGTSSTLSALRTKKR